MVPSITEKAQLQGFLADAAANPTPPANYGALRLAEVTPPATNGALRLAEVTPPAINGGLRLAGCRDGCRARPARPDYSRVLDVYANSTILLSSVFTRSRTGKGTGLGLSISHRVITQHGGEIEATSPGLNQGSTFTVRLPLQPAEPAKEEAPVRLAA